jgi:AraC-like DNA-binding protein
MNNFSNHSVFFSTDTLPERDRFPAFCEEMFRRMLLLDVAKSDGGSFRGSVEVCRTGAVELAAVCTTSADYIRTSELIRDGKDSLFAVLPKYGQLFTTQGGDVRRLAPGALTICDSTEIGGLKITDNSKFLALQIPRHLITELVPQISRFAGLQSEPSSVAVRLLTSYLNLICDELVGNETEAAKLFGKHLVDLVGLALGAHGERRQLIEQRGVRTARREAIYQKIERNIDDPELNASRVAAALGITPRYVHLLLEEAGHTFSQYVLEKRLGNVYARLRSSQYSMSKIADIAYGSGFIDLSHFNRSFRLRFGMTPSDLRAGTSTRRGN